MLHSSCMRPSLSASTGATSLHLHSRHHRLRLVPLFLAVVLFLSSTNQHVTAQRTTRFLSALAVLPLLASAAPPPVQLAAAASTLPVRPAPGLPSNALSSNGIALGFLPNWSVEGPRALNAAMGAGMAAIGDYINVSPSDTLMRQFEYHESEVLAVAKGNVKAVYVPAVLFSSTLDQWTDQMSKNLAQRCKDLNDQGVTVWVRWCFEMNGSWMAYGLDPSLYVSTWRSVTNAIRLVTNETYMLWAPNVWSGDVDDASQGYTPYWPGEEYVDLVGLSLYSFGPYKSLNKPPSTSLFTSSFSPFYALFAPTSSNNPLKLSTSYPQLITETAAPFYRSIPASSAYYTQQGDTDIAAPQPNFSSTADQTRFPPSLASPPTAKSDDELFIKASWMAQLTGNTTAIRFPNLKVVNHFNYLKKGNGTAEVLADFRFLGGNSTVEQWLRQSFGNQTAYEEGYTGDSSRSYGGKGGWTTVAAMLVSLAVAVEMC